MATDKIYQRISFQLNEIIAGEYENCEFINCSLSGMDLSRIIFIDCKFDTCDLSNISSVKTTLNHCVFTDCKLIGVHFEDINPTLCHLTFKDCDLSYSTFTGMALKKLTLSGCICHEVDFTEADLSESLLENCDLLNARFEFTDLRKANLQSSFN